MIYGLINITTSYQNPEHQKRIIRKQYPEAIVDERNDYTTLLSICKENDIIVMQNILKLYDRNTGETEEIFNIILERYQQIFNKGVSIIILEQPCLNSEVYKKAIISQHDIKNIAAGAVSVVLQEQISISINQLLNKKNSIKNSIKSRKGCPPANKGKKMVTTKEVNSKEYIKTNLIDFGGTKTNSEVISYLGLARNTFYKYKRELMELSYPEKLAEKERKKEKNKLLKESKQTEGKHNTKENKSKGNSSQMSLTDFL